MFNTLQGRQAAFEETVGALRDTLPEPMFKFLTTVGSEWDTPVVGNAIVRPPIPGPDVFDLRKANTEALKHRSTTARLSTCDGQADYLGSVIPCFGDELSSTIGSNNWAVDGAHDD